jgi:hypothetical protein
MVQILTAVIKQQRHESCQDFLQLVQQYPATSDCLWFNAEAHFHLDGFMIKQNTGCWASENPYIFTETSLHPAEWCAFSKQGFTGPIFVEGTITKQLYLQQLQNYVIPVIQRVGHMNTTFL